MRTEPSLQVVGYSSAVFQRVCQNLTETALAGASDAQLIGALGALLLEAGVPVDVIEADCDAVSPERKQHVLRWPADHVSVDNASLSDTVFAYMVEQQVGMLLAADSKNLFPFVAEDKATDAVAFATHLAPDITVGFFDDVLTYFSTREIGGFKPSDIAMLKLVVPVFALALGARLNAGAARLLLQTYLGQDAAAALLDGRVGLGEVAKIRAVVIYCDLVGFTPLTETLDAQALIDELNLFFEIMTQPVSRAGGQVSGHVGDAVIMFFPVVDRETEGKLCAIAVEAVLEGFKALGELNASQSRQAAPELLARVGIDIGDVVHGNIGSAGRFSFTIIGSPVNRAARLQALAADVGAVILMTDLFAGAADINCREFGQYSLKGFDEPIVAVGYSKDPQDAPN